ncbi:putative HPT domain superfamily protein [Helianthus annuus]|uniref:Histidine-containing phosphotransfer protein n=1 Tax=Helianthus annuus TaxID=4232 RepID=A0A9K3JT55_HELAN|nr:putative HPT domain superfamily protein [Helianthus annuus]
MDRWFKKSRAQCQNRKVKTKIKVDLRSTHEDSETAFTSRTLSETFFRKARNHGRSLSIARAVYRVHNISVCEGYLDDQFTQLQKLQDESNPDFVAELVSLFLKTPKSFLTILQLLYNQQKIVDYKQVDSHVHQFKGSSSRGAVFTSETAVRRKTLMDECLWCLQQVKHEYILVRNKLEALFRLACTHVNESSKRRSYL